MDVHSFHLLFDHFQFAMIQGPIPGPNAILLFIASDFTSIISHIHNWVLFSLWLCSSFFLELFLHSSLGASWAPTNLEFIFHCLVFLPFHTVHQVLKASILKWYTIPFSSGPCFVRTLHHDQSILEGPCMVWLVIH